MKSLNKYRHIQIKDQRINTYEDHIDLYRLIGRKYFLLSTFLYDLILFL